MYNQRWQQRFQNYEKAFLLLKEASELDMNQISDLEKEGIIQRFEYTYELAWELLKDYLEYSGIVLKQQTPRHVIKQAYSSSLLVDIQLWIEMIDQRNLLSHTYNQETFTKSVEMITNHYIHAFSELYAYFKELINNGLSIN